MNYVCFTLLKYIISSVLFYENKNIIVLFKFDKYNIKFMCGPFILIIMISLLNFLYIIISCMFYNHSQEMKIRTFMVYVYLY